MLADVITRTGGLIALEWPRGCTYWKLPKVQKFLSDYGLVESFFDGCAYGLCAPNGLPMKKPWTVVTNLQELHLVLQRGALTTQVSTNPWKVVT